MACYHPLKAFGRRPAGSLKREIAFCNDPHANFIIKDGLLYSEPLEIPCGQCIGCRLEYSRQWAVRCTLESLSYNHNYFITLTYNDDNVPLQRFTRIDQDTGELVVDRDVSPLVPDHLKKFLKDLRRYFDYHYDFVGIRFFACGEYGPKNLRPHFHLILFNCPIPDLKFEVSNFRGDCYYSSAILNKIWGKGFVTIGDFSFDCAAYVARYMLKKHKGKDSDFYAENGIIPEFTRCSRDPGIARSYYDQNRDKIYEFDNLIVTGSDGKALRVRPPSYYDRLYDIDSPEALLEIKLHRAEVARRHNDVIMSRTDKSREAYLSVLENNKLSRVVSLVRNLD